MHRLHDIAYTSLSRSPICDDELAFNPFPLSSLSLPETLTTPEFISISSALFIFVFLCCVCVGSTKEMVGVPFEKFLQFSPLHNASFLLQSKQSN